MQAEKSYDTLPNFTAADCKYLKINPESSLVHKIKLYSIVIYN